MTYRPALLASVSAKALAARQQAATAAQEAAAAGTDLAPVQAAVAALQTQVGSTTTIGGTASPETLTLAAVPAQTVGVQFTLHGTYTGSSAPTLDYSLDGGVTWSAASGTPQAGVFSIPVTASTANAAAVPKVRDHNTPSITATAAAFAIVAAAPVITKPAAPMITLTAGDGEIVVAIVDGSNGGAAITSHNLYQGGTSGAETLVGSITTGSPYTITGLTNGVPVFVQVSAVNTAGEGPRSSEQSATPMAVASGLTPGIYFPDTVYALSNGGSFNNGTTPLAAGFVRGLVAPPTIVQSKGEGPFYLNGTLIFHQFGDTPAGTSTDTITVTDGVNTWTKTFTIISGTVCVTVNKNFVLDTDPTDSGTNDAYVCAYQCWGNTGPETFSDPSGLFEGGGGYIHLIDKSKIAANLGAHTVSMSFPTATGTYTQNIELFIATEVPPVLAFIPVLPYRDNVPPLVNPDIAQDAAPSLFGTISAFGDVGVGAITIAGTSGLVSNPSGAIYVAEPLTAGPLALTFSVTSGYGTRTNTLSINASIAAGTNLPAADIAVDLTPSLDNTIGTTIQPAPVVVANVSIPAAAMSAPTWSVTLQGESPLDTGNGVYQSAFYITPNATDPTKATVYANFLSAGSPVMVITALQGTTQCISTTTLTVADATTTGPTITVVPGSGAATATTTSLFNDAFNKYLTAPTANKGMTISLPGGLYPSIQAVDSSGTKEFNKHNNIPGPLVITGPADQSNPCVINLYGCGGISESGLGFVGGDVRLKNLVVGFVSGGEGNCAAVNKIGNSPYNFEMDAVRTFNSDNGFLSGHCEESVLTLNNCMSAYCGSGNYGTTHGLYIGHMQQAIINNLTTASCGGGHELKCRSRRTDITGGIFAQGQNGIGASCIDLPDGGIANVTNAVLQKGPYPNNPALLQFAEEAHATTLGGGPLHGTNILTVSGCTFLNTTYPGALTTNVVAINTFYSTPLVSPITGLGITIIVKNCKFYNLPRDQWVNGFDGLRFIDGGGNTHLTEWPGLVMIDPATNAEITAALAPSAALFNPSSQDAILDPREMQTLVTSSNRVGDAITQFFTYDTSRVPLTNTVWSMSDPNFTIDAATGIMRLSTTAPTGSSITGGSGITWPTAKAVGTDHTGASQTYYKTIAAIWGSGYVPGRDTAGGPVTQA